MLNEKELRRTGFRDGMSIELADGQSWVFPIPAEGTDLGEERLAADPDLLDLLDAIRESEDRAEMLRAELALAIHLLDQNYDMTPHQLRTLLEFDLDDPNQTAVQGAFHALAAQALRQVPPRGTERSAGRTRPGLLARLASRFARERTNERSSDFQPGWHAEQRTSILISRSGSRLDQPPSGPIRVINR